MFRHLFFLLLFLIGEAGAEDPAARYAQLARKRFDQGLYKEAVTYYQAALKINPNFKAARMHLGLALMATKEYAAAEREFTEVLAGDGTHAFTHYNLGCAKALQGKKKEALRSLHRAFLLDRRLLETARIDRDLEGLREEEGFRALMKVFEVEEEGAAAGAGG